MAFLRRFLCPHNISGLIGVPCWRMHGFYIIREQAVFLNAVYYEISVPLGAIIHPSPTTQLDLMPIFSRIIKLRKK